MTPREYIEDAAATLGVDIYRTRLPDIIDPGKGAVVISLAGRDYGHTTDGPSNALGTYFEMRTISSSATGAETLARAMIDGIRPRLADIISEYDDTDATGAPAGQFVFVTNLVVRGE